jgi:hypothetical protein
MKKIQYSTLDWKYILQFIVPIKFKTNAHKANKENPGCTWWMYMGHCFNIKWN